MENFVILSGCSGGGKSTLLAELARRGHATVEEPGRRIVIEELKTGGTALPWTDPLAFLHRAIAVPLKDRARFENHTGWVFFDRGLIDAKIGLEHLTGQPVQLSPSHQSHRTVFLTPPWPEIYVTDPERRHGFEEAQAEYARLLLGYPKLGYEISILPKVSVTERADLIERALSA